MFSVVTAILLSAATAPHYDPKNVLVEHCVSTGGSVHCLLEQIDHGTMQLLMTREDHTALALSPMRAVIASQRQQTVSEHRYNAMLEDVFGTYLYDQNAQGLPEITAVGFPAWFTPLADVHSMTAHQQRDPLAANPLLSSGGGFSHHCLAGILGDMLGIAGAGALGGMKLAQEAIPNNPQATITGAIGGALIGAVTGAIKGYADYCEDPTATADCKPEPSTDDGTPPTTSETPLPDAAPKTGITNPQPHKDAPISPLTNLMDPHGERLTPTPPKAVPPAPTAYLSKHIIPNDAHTVTAPKTPPAPMRIDTFINPGSGSVSRPPAPRGDR